MAETASRGYQHYPECPRAFHFLPLCGEVGCFLSGVTAITLPHLSEVGSVLGFLQCLLENSLAFSII